MAADAAAVVSLAVLEGGEHPVYVISFCNSRRPKGGYENKLSARFCKDFLKLLDRVEEHAAQNGGKGALVTVSAVDNGRPPTHYCNGLDLEDALNGPDGTSAFLVGVQALFCKILTFPMPTVACINGHAFAGGWLLALCHDHRVMTSERANACMTEIDLGFPLTPGFNALLKEKMPRQMAARMMLEAARFDAQELGKHHLVTAVAPTSELLKVATELAGKLAPKAGSPIMRQLKEDLYTESCIQLNRSPDRTDIDFTAKL